MINFFVLILFDVLFSSDKAITNKILWFLIKKYNKAYLKMMASRDYLYCVRPVYISIAGFKRPGYCSVQINNNAKLSISEIATIMGHSNLATTYRYTHDNKNKKNEVTQIWDDIYETKSFSIKKQ